LPLFAGANPDRRALDAVVPDRPVFLWAADGHSAWVNSRALELAGLTAASPDPPGGRIERDPSTGEPTGTLRESAADLVARLLPVPSAAAREDALTRAVALAHRAGITGVLEATADADSLAAFLALDRRGELDLHVAIAGTLDPEQPLAPQVEHLERLRAETASTRVRLLAGKLFVDGVVESGTAALLSPYLDPTSAEPVDSRGELLWTEPELLEALLALDRAGLQLHAHVIGDRALRAALDAIETTARQRGERDRRPTLAHVQLVEPSDLTRFRALAAIACVQPLWAYADSYIRDLTEPVLGPTRSRWLYPLASLQRSGAVVVAGSDWSVSSIEPLDGIEVALTRRAPDETSGSTLAPDSAPTWIPEERVDLETMLAAYTIRAAYASFRESTTGSLEVGKSADLVVLDRDLFAIPPADISETEVLWTLFEGREVWRHPDFEPTRLAPVAPDPPAPAPTAGRAAASRRDAASSGRDSRHGAKTSIESRGRGSIGRSRRIGGNDRARRLDRATGVQVRRFVSYVEAFRSSSWSRLEQERLVSVSRRAGGI
jgi:predicted amidohydrolase YtcJ